MRTKGGIFPRTEKITREILNSNTEILSDDPRFIPFAAFKTRAIRPNIEVR